MVGLGDLPGGSFISIAADVSDDGSIVVGLGSSELGEVAMIWDEINGMRSLKDVLENDFGLDLTGWELDSAQEISGDGTTIVGVGNNEIGQTEAWRAVIPEPSSAALFAGGILIAASRGRSRRQT